MNSIRTHRLSSAVALALTGLLSVPAQATDVVPLSTLNGHSGFRLDGVQAGDYSGISVSSAGDINGDGIDDVIVGASRAASNGERSGRSYLVFGRLESFASSINLSSLDGSNGFRLDGVAAGDSSGQVVSAAGDVNGDGVDDLAIGAVRAEPNGSYSGSSYVVFGRSTGGFDSVFQLSNLDGSNGLRIDGVSEGDVSGYAISSVGDFNGDRIDDLIIGAWGADPNGGSSGSSYVVFGRSSVGFASAFDLSMLDGVNGFRLDGPDAEEFSGRAVSGAGDINDDGIDDLIIGAHWASPNGERSGSSYVVFGSSAGGFPSVMNLSELDGSNGFRLDCPASRDYCGRSVSGAGDFNGDGIDDLIVGAYLASPNGNSFSGSSYVVFGRGTGGFAPVINLSTLDGINGFRLDGDFLNMSGREVAGAGDINADGIDDLIIGVVGVDLNGNNNAGSNYVVFGQRTNTFAPVIPLSTLDGVGGFRLDGVSPNDLNGQALSGAGDMNGDGIDDLIVGAYRADPNGDSSGSSYVVFGARDRIFRDGAEEENIDVLFPQLKVRYGSQERAVRWHNGATCRCDFLPFDFSIKGVADDLTFFWPAVSGLNGGVSEGGVYSVLQPGAVVGPSSTFINEETASATANWRSGADGYLGFRFVNARGQLNYGYARIRSSAPTGYPVELVEIGVNITGLAVTIPAE